MHKLTAAMLPESNGKVRAKNSDGLHIQGIKRDRSFASPSHEVAKVDDRGLVVYTCGTSRGSCGSKLW